MIANGTGTCDTCFTAVFWRRQFLMADENPNSHPSDNAEKDPDTWVSGDDPITGAQASYLKTLSEQADDPDAFDETISKAEASKRIDALKAKLGLD